MEKLVINRDSFLPYILAFIIFLIYLPNIIPAHSWASAGVDHFDFVLAAQHGLVPHSTGFPVYIIPANLILWGADSLKLTEFFHPAWILALTLSTIPAVVNTLLVFFITKKLTSEYVSLNYQHSAYIPYTAMLTLAGAGLLLSQAFIVETKPYSIMLALTVILLYLYKKFNWSALFIGLVAGAHGLTWSIIGLFWLLNWKIYLPKIWITVPTTILPYGYLLWGISRIEPVHMTTLINGNFIDFYNYLTFGTSSKWWGTLPIWDLPERLWDTVILFSTSFGLTLLGLILLWKNQLWKKLIWLMIIIIPTMYYWIGTTPKIVHVHLAIAIPFLIILAALGISNSKIHPRYFIAVSCLFILIIPFYWQIGKHIDPQLAAQNYYEELHKIPDGSIILPMSLILEADGYNEGAISDGTGAWWTIILHNLNYERRLIAIQPDKYLASPWVTRTDSGELINVSYWYRNILRDEGLNIPYTRIHVDTIEKEWFIIQKDIKLKAPEEVSCRLNCKSLLETATQFKYWLTIDELAQVNPDRKIYLIGRIGTSNRSYTLIEYDRNLLSPLHLSVLEKIEKELEAYAQYY